MRRYVRRALKVAGFFLVFAPLMCLDLLCVGPADTAPPPPQPPAQPSASPPLSPVAPPAAKVDPKPAPQPGTRNPELTNDDLASPLKPAPGTYHKDSKIPVPKLPEPPAGHLKWPALTDIRKALVDGVIDPVPEPLKALDGKEAVLTGYLVVPFPSDAVREFYLAAGPWDGCCIGKPPTLFDSVAVQLKEGGKLTEPRRWIVTVRGTLRVRPSYDEEGKLSGLYSLEGAAEVAGGQ
jgi:hypothetical protein